VTAADIEKNICGAKFSLVVNSVRMAKAMNSRTLADGVTWVRDQTSKVSPNPDTQAA
jgi:hypothetical protein